MNNIGSNIERIENELGDTVTLVAISKTKPVETVKKAYHCGQKIFGENTPQELYTKHEQLPKDIIWHIVGHLQTNKVKYLAPFVDTVQSVDRLKLLRYLDREAQKHNRVIKCLLQFHIAEEGSKFGLSQEEAVTILTDKRVQSMQNISINGVMGIATLTDNTDQIRKEFRELRQIFNRLKSRFFENDPNFREISMGMSGDYQIAVEEGSTIVRIGSAIFGSR